MPEYYDTIVIGSGIAGLSLAYRLAEGGQKVFIASKEAITEGSSKYAQGGVAVVSPFNEQDSVLQHLDDTIAAGAGLCNPEIVKVFIENGWQAVKEVIDLGISFDDDYHLEAAHHQRRVLHKGDSTGREILKVLVDKVSRSKNIAISQGTEAISLLKTQDRVCGMRFVTVTGDEFDILASNVVLACGGYAGLFERYTCPQILTGDGIALAYDAGAKIENLEFIQFHPTVFENNLGQSFLISEALRGAGAKLLNSKKENFAHRFDSRAELAARDVLCRTIFLEMKSTNSDFVYLDARNLGKTLLETKFPLIYKHCLTQGFDLSQDLLPVKPAAHYSIGGIKVDQNGQTSVHGLYAIGEASSTGLHGANRLASNSLLECLVGSKLTSKIILNKNIDPTITAYDYCSNYFVAHDYCEREEYKKILEEIRSIVSRNLAMERKQKSIEASIKLLESLPNVKEKTTALLIAKSALLRKESRGCHFRIDTPRSSKQFERSTIISKDSTVKRIKLAATI